MHWTFAKMQRPDYLFAWHYNKGKIIDNNNAIDGDMFIAYSLLLAYKKWKKPLYLQNASNIIKNIKEYILEINSNYIILPAKYGFVKQNKIIIFPSYYIPFILKEFYLFDKDQIWLETRKYFYKKFPKLLLTDKMNFDLLKKEIYPGIYASMDVYRVILYTLLDQKNPKIFQNSFSEIYNFFQKNGYIPLKYNIRSQIQTKKESPYCVYHLFYILYSDKRMLIKYDKLKKIDKNNYFCEFLEFFLKDKKWQNRLF
jgi:endoglucanase